jgi:UDP-2,3-diacylglucosamine pyrophosphatase LpxH
MYAEKVLASGDADIVVCGHSHWPVMEQHPTPSGTGYYINAGDWLYHKTYVEWDGNGFYLKLFRSDAEDVVQSEIVPKRESADCRQ